MPLPAETAFETLLLVGKIALLAPLSFLALLKWAQHRRCAYHVDTGFWRLMVLGAGLYLLGRGAALLGETSELARFALEGLVLVGILSVIVALIRLSLWQPHRHATP